MAKNPLLKTVFRTQLKAAAPDTIVGKAGTDCTCPIANALKALGHRFPSANHYSLYCYPYPPTPTTKWQKAFMTTLDNTHIAYTPITAARALEILASL